MNTRPVRVLVVDDQELVLDGIASLLGIQLGISVVGTASDGKVFPLTYDIPVDHPEAIETSEGE